MTNPSSKYRRGTSFTLSFPTFPSYKSTPQRVDLYQSVYSHDILVIEFPTINHTWMKHLKTGVPVKFVWKQGKVSNTFLGYVYSLSTKEVAGQRRKEMHITVLGSSFRLKQRSNQTFSNKTIPEVAAIIAKQHKLHFVGDLDNRRFPYLAIGGHSYWEWLHVHAQKIGFAMFITGTTLVFKSLDKLLNSTANNAPVLSYFSYDTTLNAQILDRTLDSLTVTKGDYVEGVGAPRTLKQIGGVDPITNKILLSQTDPSQVGLNLRVDSAAVLFSEPLIDQVANSSEAANAAADGAAQLARFNIPAKTVGQGDPRVRPFLPVMITGTGDQTDGYWVVTKAHHMMHRIGDYQMELEIASDGLGVNAVNSFRSGDSDNLGVVDPEEGLLDTLDSTVDSTVASKLSDQFAVFDDVTQEFTLSPQIWETSHNTGIGCCP